MKICYFHRLLTGLLSMIFLYGISFGRPEQIFDIRDFVAIGDGIQLDTKAIQAAVDQCAENGQKLELPVQL